MRRLWLVLLLTACTSPAKAPVASPSPTPTWEAVEGTESFGDPASLAFAPSGDLWVGNYESSSLARYPAPFASGVPKAASVITAAAVKGPNAMVFDAHGFLWVPMYGNGTVAGFSPADLAAGRAPSVVLTADPGVLLQPAGVALDPKTSDLWVSNAAVGHIVRFPRDGLELGASKADVVLNVPDEGCQGIAIRDGRLWHACAKTDTLYVYDLPTRSGTPKPVATIAWPTDKPCGPVLLVTTADRLGVACYSGSVVLLPAVAKSGAPEETFRITAPELANVHGLAIDPSGAVWAGTNLNAILRFPEGMTVPDLVMRAR
jgi:sugar lactone lactonase YvrE